jgi:uncharacterized protein
MERVLYNGFAGAIATGGTRFFYVNPLQRRADHFEKDDPGRRREWFNCACCPPNIMRLIASLQHYLATVSGDTLHVHQFTGATLTSGAFTVQMTTGYPWSGGVRLRVTSAPPAACGLALRVPAWSANPVLLLNESPLAADPSSAGYVTVRRRWHPGDVLTYRLDMKPRLTYPNRRVDAVRGTAALERGPLVYCFEQADQPEGTDLEDLALTGAALREHPATVPGVGPTVLVEADAVRQPPVAADEQFLYSSAQPAKPVTATAIPYFQWDNRDGRAMRVWLPRA